MTARVSKMQFAREETKCLGYVVGHGKIVPDPDKVKAIENFSACTSKKLVVAMLGVTCCYRKYLENYSQRSFPLTDLT